MIYTLTFNPSIDYEMSVTHFKVNHTNRSTHEDYRLGGKGINVSYVLKELGFNSTILGFIGGFIGKEIKNKIHEVNLYEQLIQLEEGVSRVNVKLLGKNETEINGEGPFISSIDMKQLYDQLEKLTEEDVLILSGSIPKCLNDNIYEIILSVQTKKGVCCVVDATGTLLKNTLKYHPFLIKPNVKECEELLNKNLVSTGDIVEAAKELQQLGAKNVLVSRGSQGAILVDENGKVYEHRGLKGDVVSTVGCGDSMVAGFIAAYLKCRNYDEAFKMALSCGCASAFSRGLANINKIKECYLEIEKIVH